MNMDFHYYVTYLASLNAGFNADEAQIIAYSAQYVDDSNHDRVKEDLLQGITPCIPTSETLNKMKKKAVGTLGYTSDADLLESKKIWSSFHFLPGNRDEDKQQKVKYNGPQKSYFTSFGEKERDDFRYLCLPNSSLSQDMINDIIDHHKDRNYYLHLLGIRMHVLADTWAHQFFAGLCSWWINNVSTDDVYWVSKKEKILFNHASSIEDLDPRVPFECTPKGISYQSYCQLGHGRVGHLPDLPYANYFYKPHWSSITRERNNPEEFLNAYNQLVHAMICVRTKKQFNKSTYYQPNNPRDRNLQVEIVARLKDRNYDERKAYSTWAPLIKQTFEANIDVYDANYWLNLAQEAPKKKKTDYYKFNKAANLHLEFVTQEMHKK